MPFIAATYCHSSLPTQFYDSKNLVNSLENERDRYLKLEEEYRRFAKEAHRERERLAQEIRLLQDDSSTDIVSLQKALMHKQDEYLEVCRRFEEEKMKSDESVTLLRNDREKLGQELARMRHALTEADTSMKEQKQFVTKVLSEKKRMADQLAVQVADTKKAQEQLKEREANWLAEKEMRMQLDVHIIQLQHTLAQREDECKELRNQSARKDAEISDLRRLQFTVEQLQKRIVEHKEKEAKLQETIEGHVARERQMVMDQQDLERQEKRHAEDLHRLSLQENAKVLEVEKLKQQLKAYAGEVQQWMDSMCARLCGTLASYNLHNTVLFTSFSLPRF